MFDSLLSGMNKIGWNERTHFVCYHWLTDTDSE